jgi:hypothetical protein
MTKERRIKTKMEAEKKERGARRNRKRTKENKEHSYF